MNYSRISVKKAASFLDTELYVKKRNSCPVTVQSVKNTGTSHLGDGDEHRNYQRMKQEEKYKNQSVYQNIICISDDDEEETDSKNEHVFVSRKLKKDCVTRSSRRRKGEVFLSDEEEIVDKQEDRRMAVETKVSEEQREDDNFWHNHNPTLFPNDDKRISKKMTWTEKYQLHSSKDSDDVQLLKEIAPLKEMNGCVIKSRLSKSKLAIRQGVKGPAVTRAKKKPLVLMFKKRGTSSGVGQKETDQGVRLNEKKWFENLIEEFGTSKSRLDSGFPKWRDVKAPRLFESDMKLLEATKHSLNKLPTSRQKDPAVVVELPDSEDEEETGACYVKSSPQESLKLANSSENRNAEKKRQFYGREAKKSKEYGLEESLFNQMKITDVSTDDDPIVISDDEDNKEDDVVRVLPSQAERAVDAVLRKRPAETVVVEGFGLALRWKDIQRLEGFNWLNDEVINFYMNLIMQRSKNSSYPAVYCFNTFFYPKLAATGHESLKRWTRKHDIFSNEILLVPIHLGFHWCLASVNIPEKQIKYYDSMGGENTACLKNILKYLHDELLDKKQKHFSETGWHLCNVKNNPHQLNGSDCGVFACLYAEHISRRAKMTFSQSDIPYFRRKMVYEITSKRLMDEF